ncbi:MAG: hypothetical protein M3503_02920 [Actinomycetota bacterium]|nr:hypothetical protein [Actinomycetota bacterium]
MALRVAGIGLEEIVDLVSGAAEAPPLNSVAAGEVHRWVERAAERMIDPRRVRHLRQAVDKLLDAQFVLDHRAAEHSERLRYLAEVAAAHRAGTYWRDRDARRTATRPIHVEVDPRAWQRVKRDAIRRGTTLGQAVGELIQAEVDGGGQTLGENFGEVSIALAGHQGQGRRAQVFARIALGDDAWRALKPSPPSAS